MKKENRNVKIIFSLISLFLMLPMLLAGDSNYYRTLFIFLINRVIDIILQEKRDIPVFLMAWSLINQWLGVIATAVAFCSIAPDFANLFAKHSMVVNLALFIAAISCILNELLELIVISIKEELVIKKVANDLKIRGDL